MADVYLSIGSNIECKKNICAILTELHNRFGTLISSPIYESSALGFEGNSFQNLTVKFNADINLPELCEWLLAKEIQYGRDIDADSFTDRTLDLDLLLFDDVILYNTDIEIPRKDILQYPFVLKALADIAPLENHPLLGQTYQQLWNNFKLNKVDLINKTAEYSDLLTTIDISFKNLQTPLGKSVEYQKPYNSELLSLPRKTKRKEIGIEQPLPFTGIDIWNAYELSWLNENGKPNVASAEIIVPCESENIIESKSLKLYFNRFNQTKFSSQLEVEQIIKNDLTVAVGKPVKIKLLNKHTPVFMSTTGICLDNLDITVNNYQLNTDLLSVGEEIIEETVFSELLRSNCLITGQPDWGTIIIYYKGKKINHQNLLHYIISFRQHSYFGEHCVERIYHDLWQHCQPEKLSVYARYTRRGGIDLNPFRSNFLIFPDNERIWRQ